MNDIKFHVLFVIGIIMCVVGLSKITHSSRSVEVCEPTGVMKKGKVELKCEYKEYR